jgi:preprotein translocase subunit SecD
LGGFDLRIQFNSQGTWMLQNYSASNNGKHYAIFSQFGVDGKKARWLAAPVFNRLISDGVIQFTPDASREEAEEIARGLNNFAKKNADKDKWKD